jgi:hypothetical protein
MLPHIKQKMKTALFTNYTDKDFIGYWDGKAKKFSPGQSLYMPDYLARHFAKHLTNRELLRTDESGNLIYKDGEKMTSPKKPEEVPMFMDLFNKAYTPDETDELGSNKDDIDSLIGAANKNREKKLLSKEEVKKQSKEKVDPTKPQTVLPPDFDEEEDEFEGKPKE